MIFYPEHYTQKCFVHFKFPTLHTLSKVPHDFLNQQTLNYLLCVIHGAIYVNLSLLLVIQKYDIAFTK